MSSTGARPDNPASPKTANQEKEPNSDSREIGLIDDFDDLLQVVGSNGKYQKFLLYGVIGPFSAVLPIFFLNTIFLLSEPDHYCHVPWSTNGTSPPPPSLEAWKNLTIPRETGADGTERFSQCLMFASLENDTGIPCNQGWDYDLTDYAATIPTDFNWVCDKSDYVTQAFTASAVGSGIGTIIFGWAGDRFGRKPFFFVCCSMLTFFRVLSLFILKDFTLFLAAQFLTGSIFPMIYIFLFQIAVELTDKESRAWVYGLSWIIWVAGICILPLIAWLARHWFLLGLLTSLPGFLLLLYYNHVPESPRWLLTQGRLKEAEAILVAVATTNGNSQKLQPGDLGKILRNVKAVQDKRNEGQGPVTILSLFSRKRLGLNTLLVSIAWAMNSIIYYGITLSTTSLAGNQFLNFFILAIIELPVGWMGGFLAEKTGRRWTQSFFFAVCALGFGIAAVGSSHAHLSVLIILSLVVCKFCVATTSLIVTLQAAEIFPTELRSTGNGFACSFGSMAAICTPFIIFLGKVHSSIPYVAFAVISLVGTISASFLPETLNQTLPETLEDGVELGREVKYWSYLPKDYKNPKVRTEIS